MQKFSKFMEKIEKHNYHASFNDDDFQDGCRKISDSEVHNLAKTPTKSIEMTTFFMHNHLNNHE